MRNKNREGEREKIVDKIKKRKKNIDIKERMKIS